MAISDQKLKLIRNNHLEETEMLLHRLLKEKDMSQAEFAKKIGKDASTINRWIKNSRAIAWDSAEKIAKVLGVHPVDVYQPNKKIILKQKCSWNGVIVDYPKEEQLSINIPYEYNTECVRAVLMDCPGTSTDGEIWLFDTPKTKKFVKTAITKHCYIEPTAEAIKLAKKQFNHDCTPCLGVLKPNGDGTLSIIGSITGKPLNEACVNVPPNFLKIAVPVKAKYDPDQL